ncbi:hypothetical protein L3Q82_023299, partial [Scortum barcoo]
VICHLSPERSTGPVSREETKQRSDRWTRDEEDAESQREQVIWRLERLLGDACNDGGRVAGEEAHPLSDSIRTEDFFRRFRDEMVELPPPRDGEAERAETETHYSQSDRRAEKRLPDSCGVNKSHAGEAAAAGGRLSSPQRTADGGSISHRSEFVQHETSHQISSRPPQARCLAGVPVWSFDAVSIDSDLDSVCTEQVRQHIHRRPGWRSLIQSVTNMDDFSTNQSDDDTPTQEDSEPTSDQRSAYTNMNNRPPSARKTHRNNRETYSLVCSLGDNEKDTDEESNHWRRRRRPERTLERARSDWADMKERLSELRQRCEEEEETLQMKRTQLKDAELSLSELERSRKHALQDLERLTLETAGMEKGKRTLEFVLRDGGAESCEFQRQRESCHLEVRDAAQRKQTLKDVAFMERPGVVMSVLEREDLDRQLDGAKTDLFAEQRRAREKLEAMQEKLEETREELQRVKEAESSLRNRCACLEEKRRQEKDQIEAELGECRIRAGTLEKMLAQKELQLLDLQERRRALQAETDGLKGALQHLKTQHCDALKKAQEQAHRVMEAALKQQEKDLSLAHELQIQQINQQTEEEKANALKEQSLSHTRHIDSLKRSIQLKEEEAKKLRYSVEQQEEQTKICEKELHVKTSEQVRRAVEEEGKRWEAEKVEAVQVHCGMLEEQNRKSLESSRSEMQREKCRAQALQHKVAELKKRVQELEGQSCAQQREQESLLAVVCKSLKEEHQAELQKLRGQMAQESRRAALRLEQAVQLAEREADRLRAMLEERESSHNQIRAELDEQHRLWARELGAECQHLHLLVEPNGAKQHPVQLHPNPTVTEALENLGILREQLKHLISHLHQELDSEKQTTEQLRKDKERELSIQRQQLRMERDQALDSLKERLIQEHIEELSSVNWAHACDGGGAGGRGAAASLRKQLKAKDLELRQVQRSMAQWKEQTTARLACKFEEELTAELERKKTGEERQRKCERPEGEMSASAKEARSSVCSPSLHVAASHSPSDVASFKLLRYLQGKVRQLRVENQANTWSPSPSRPLDLSGSYLSTVSTH